MRALDPKERKEFKGFSQNESLLKLVETRNVKREEYSELKKLWPKEAFLTQLEDQRNKIQALAQRIANLKQEQTKQSE